MNPSTKIANELVLPYLLETLRVARPQNTTSNLLALPPMANGPSFQDTTLAFRKLRLNETDSSSISRDSVVPFTIWKRVQNRQFERLFMTRNAILRMAKRSFWNQSNTRYCWLIRWSHILNEPEHCCSCLTYVVMENALVLTTMVWSCELKDQSQLDSPPQEDTKVIEVGSG